MVDFFLLHKNYPKSKRNGAKSKEEKQDKYHQYTMKDICFQLKNNCLQ